MTKEMREEIEHKYWKLHTTRGILFRAFAINYVSVFAAWLVSMTGFFDWSIRMFTRFNPADSYEFMMNCLAIWQILGVALFLVPALAVWWQMCAIRKWME